MVVGRGRWVEVCCLYDVSDVYAINEREISIYVTYVNKYIYICLYLFLYDIYIHIPKVITYKIK